MRFFRQYQEWQNKIFWENIRQNQDSQFLCNTEPAREDIGRASNANDSKMLLLRLLLLLPPFWGNEITRVSPRLEQAWIGPPQGYPSWARRQSGCCRCCRCCCCCCRCRWRPRSLDSEDKWEEEEEAALTSSWSRWWWVQKNRSKKLQVYSIFFKL